MVESRRVSKHKHSLSNLLPKRCFAEGPPE